MASNLSQQLAQWFAQNDPYEVPEVFKCRSCDNLDFSGQPWWFKSTEVQNLLKTATEGCFCCRLRLLGVQPFPDLWQYVIAPQEKSRPVIFGISFNRSRPLELSVTEYDRDSEGGMQSRRRRDEVLLMFYTLKDIPGWESFGTGRHRSLDTSSSKTLDKVRGWLEDCSLHSTCTLYSQMVRLPARVIDVGSSGPFLYETDGERDRYICLSWCWGPPAARPITTTRSTLSERKKGILESKLPKTFRDAIATTRELGIRYLWIDSLCIIQDDRGDWEVQSADMANIYGKAYVVLAATSGKDSRAGLFRQSNSDAVLLPAKPLLAEGTEIFVRRERSHSPLRRNENHPLYQELPLLSRGWVFQELMLPTRLLHFTDLEVVFECKQQMRCECRNDHPRLTGMKSVFSGGLEEVSKALKQWKIVVEQYTGRRLTKEIDKLPALSGLAKRFQGIIGGRYYAGLWEVDLLDCLLWVTLRDTNREGIGMLHPRGEDYIAPSWSWASTRQQVTFPFSRTKDNIPRTPGPGAKVHAVECKLSSIDPTGTISAGSLQISGRVVDAHFEYEYDKISRYWCIKDGYRAWFCPDYPLEDVVPQGQPLLCFNMSIADADSTCLLKPIVLRQKPGADSNIYERIGAFGHLDTMEAETWLHAEERLITIV